jgi:hypothetical protein
MKFEEALLAQYPAADNSASATPSANNEGSSGIPVWVWPALLLVAGVAWFWKG